MAKELQNFAPGYYTSRNTHWGAFIAAVVEPPWYILGLKGKRVVKFERGKCSLERGGKRVAWLKPKLASRADSQTISLDTGIFRLGKITLKFANSFDADKAEDILGKTVMSRSQKKKGIGTQTRRNSHT